MLLIILALFWVALLAPIAFRYFRDGGTEKSIESFHAEHEVLSRQDYSVAPAHRLDRPDTDGAATHDVARRPRLTVVHADDTFGTLESRSSWDEWSEDYDYDEFAVHGESTNHYARAYSSRPVEAVVTSRYEEPIRRRSMRSQRRMMFSRLALATLTLTAAAIILSNSILTDVAALSWFCVVVFVALAFYSVSQGYLHESSLPRLPQMPRLARRQRMASVAPLHAAPRVTPRHAAEPYVQETYANDPYADYYETPDDEEWQRQPLRRRALG